MDRLTFIRRTYQFATGEATAPTSGTEDHTRIVDLGDSFIDDWQSEPGVDWDSLYDEMDVTTVTATDTFAIDTDTIRKLVGVELRPTTGDPIKIPLVRPTELDSAIDMVARVGGNLKFSKAFASDSPYLGWTIVAKFYGFAPHLTTDATIVPVDNPMWLVYMTASEFARNDYIKSGQYGNIVALASNIMDSMKENNENGSFGYVTHGEWQPLSETMAG